MATDREKRLFAGLFGTVMLASFAVGLSLLSGRLTRVESRIRFYEEALTSLQSRYVPNGELEARKVVLVEAISERTAIFYGPDEMDQYRFGMLVRTKLLECGMKVSAYRAMNEGGEKSLEFVSSGDVEAFFRFLRFVSGQEKRWNLPSLEISRKDGRNLEVVLRIGYEEAPASVD